MEPMVAPAKLKDLTKFPELSGRQAPKYLGRQACHAKISESRSIRLLDVELHLADEYQVCYERDHACWLGHAVLCSYLSPQ